MIKITNLFFTIFIIIEFVDSKILITDDPIFCGDHVEAINNFAEEFQTIVSSQTELCALYFVNLRNKSQFTDEEKEQKAANFMKLTEQTIGDAYSELILKVAEELNLDNESLKENLEYEIEGSGFDRCAYANCLAEKISAESRLDKLRELYYETKKNE